MTELNNKIGHANYQNPGLPEYASNPFISALPLIKDTRAALNFLEILPPIDVREINLPPHIRVHAVQRLITRFFQPTAEHVLLEQRFSILIRQSYIGRNPANGLYQKHLNNGFDRIVNKDIDWPVKNDAYSTATGFSIVGPSGCGKTSAILRALSDYPLAIYHPDLHVIQIPWLKLECPRNGSLIELCYSFFRAVDERLNTGYFKTYCRPRVGVDSLIAEMAQIANLHAIGVLIIDEIQHLSRVRSGGDEAMLKFFVTLTNSIGVPVVLVGTPKARALFATDFKMAKRTTGLGSVEWDRLPKNEGWNKLIKRLWKFQWLANKEPLTQEIIDTFYDLSQGIIDVLIKLYVLAQWRAMTLRVEVSITVGLLNSVYADELKPVHKMLAALRSNDVKAIAKYGDLVMPDLELKLLEAFEDQAAFNDAAPEVKAPLLDDKAKTILSVTETLGIANDIAIPMIESELLANPDLDTMQLVQRLLNLIHTPAPKVKKPSKKPNVSLWEQLGEGDIRYMYSQRGDATTYEALKSGGVISSLSDFLAAA